MFQVNIKEYINLRNHVFLGFFFVVRPAGARFNGCKSRIRPVVGRI